MTLISEFFSILNVFKILLVACCQFKAHRLTDLHLATSEPVYLVTARPETERASIRARLQ